MHGEGLVAVVTPRESDRATRSAPEVLGVVAVDGTLPPGDDVSAHVSGPPPAVGDGEEAAAAHAGSPTGRCSSSSTVGWWRSSPGTSWNTIHTPVVDPCMQVEIWSDVVCPWCAIGKRRFESALSKFAHRDEVTVTWRSFELDPTAPQERGGTLVEHLAEKYGTAPEQALAMIGQMSDTAAVEGWAFDLEHARGGNTVDAHRLIHLGAEHGVQDAVKERLLRAYVSEREPIGDHEALTRLAVEAGLDEAEVRAVLDGDRFLDAVRADERQARAYGINGVPFFVVDAKYGVSGAQPADALLEVLETAWADAHPLQVLTPAGGAGGDACADGSCAV